MEELGRGSNDSEFPLHPALSKLPRIPNESNEKRSEPSLERTVAGSAESRQIPTRRKDVVATVKKARALVRMEYGVPEHNMTVKQTSCSASSTLVVRHRSSIPIGSGIQNQA